MYDTEIAVDLLVGLTLIKLGFASGLDEMDEIKDNFSFYVEGQDVRLLESENYHRLVREGAVLSLVEYNKEDESFS